MREPHENLFTAMGTWCHVLAINGSDGMLDDAAAEVARLESLWTRFDEASEISELNARAGEPVRVSDETILLLQRAALAHETTAGWFDPFMAGELVALGYDRDFAELPTVSGAASRCPRRRQRGSRAPLRVDPSQGTAALEPGASFDPGGIGKGLAADLVSSRIVEMGACGALVNLGGDLRCRSQQAREWQIDIDNALDPEAPPVARVRLHEGGLCTSSPHRRRWARPGGGEAHHLLDPSTGEPVANGPASVTVIAPAAWTAEALSKALYAAGPDTGQRLLRRHNAGAVVVDDGGSVQRM